MSAFRGLPKLDRIAVGIVDAREAADRGVIPFVLRDDFLARLAKRRQHGVEVVDAQVDHELAIGGEIIGVSLEGRKDQRTGGEADILERVVKRWRSQGR